LQEFFAQLYAHPSVQADPSSAGRSMNGHFGTRTINEDGSWKKLSSLKNSSSDISPTGGQMPRLLGLAFASKLFRNNPELCGHYPNFTTQGNEVAFGTIGDASTSEGIFFESMNAAGVLQVPMAISVFDDGYGISVPKKYQTIKQSISEALSGFSRNEEKPGFAILKGKGWDYAGLCEMYEQGIAIARDSHTPVLFHIEEMTQPQGHSTSGSHERYKSKKRLEWEEEFDCIKQMRQWIIELGIADSELLDTMEAECKQTAQKARKNAWDAFMAEIKSDINESVALIESLAMTSSKAEQISSIVSGLKQTLDPSRKDVLTAVRNTLRISASDVSEARIALLDWYSRQSILNHDRYNDNLYSTSILAAGKVEAVSVAYSDDPPLVDGREVLQANFDAIFSENPLVVAFGEDVGRIGDVNQAFAGLQQKFGENRIMDTGIREATIVGQGIGLAMRGFRPIAEIQYLDYLLYAIQILSDDLATLQYRTRGGQKAPLIVRTRGHRLEGIWHSGSPMGMIINSLRGIHVLVPRNMTQAAGFYNTMLASDEPALIIEPLNGYRLKEKLPENVGKFRIPIGVPDILSEGNDVTIVTYGSMCRIVMDAAKTLEDLGITCEVIDAQTLLPFDIHHRIAVSVEKTNRLVIADEDVPGGASAYLLEQILEKQNAYRHLDSPPRTITAKDHRPAYGSDGDYFSKPSVDDVVDSVYELMHEFDPVRFPPVY
jgi:2-oxoisovalerate dehydrogenase E1 component